MRIQSETKFVDIYLQPNSNPPESRNLSLLAQCLNQHPAIFEPCRSFPVAVDDSQASTDWCMLQSIEQVGA